LKLSIFWTWITFTPTLVCTMPDTPHQLRALTTRLTRPLAPLLRAVQLWLDADGLRMSAAMSFYGMLSLAPLLLLIVVENCLVHLLALRTDRTSNKPFFHGILPHHIYLPQTTESTRETPEP